MQTHVSKYTHVHVDTHTHFKVWASGRTDIGQHESEPVFISCDSLRPTSTELQGQELGCFFKAYLGASVLECKAI